MEMRKEELTLEFVAAAVTQGQAALDGDNKKADKAGKRLNKVIRVMKNDTNMARAMLDMLLFHDDPNTRTWAGAIAIDIDYRLEEAESILIDLTRDPNIGILGLNAEMSLRVRKGTLNEFGMKPL